MHGKIRSVIFALLFLVLMINFAKSETEYSNYLFAGSDKVTVLTDIQAYTSQESNQFVVKKPGLFSRIKDGIVRLFTKKSNEIISPEIELTQGTYNCGNGNCERIPEYDNIDYNAIKTAAEQTTIPGVNDLTRPGVVQPESIVPPPILTNINPKEMINALEEGYKSKREARQGQQ